MSISSSPSNELSLKGKTVLVTGAGGFIGSHLVEALIERGAHVRAMVRYNSRNFWGYLENLNSKQMEQVEILSGDITDAFFVRKAVSGCTAVFHLAALIGIPYSYIAPQQYVDVNIQGTLNVLEACRAENVEKLVHTSTSETYGTAIYAPIDEAHPMQGQSPYSATKIGADKIAESYYLSFGLPVAIIRPFNTFGPRQSSRAVIPTIISQALAFERSGEPIRLGSLEPKRDFTFVKDTAEGFIRMAEVPASAGQVINVGSGQTQTIGETLSLIQDILGKGEIPVITEEKRIRPEKSEVGLLLANAQKAKTILGWEPRYTFRAGLEEAIAYFRTQVDMNTKTTLYHV